MGESKDYIIQVSGLSKNYGSSSVLHDVTFGVRRGEFVTILGPSGSGKSTLLRIIGGFEKPNAGSIFFDGEDITKVPAEKRKINTVFQHYALFPHLNVYENIAFGLEMKGVAKQQQAERIAEVLQIVGMQGFENYDVRKLSGGQQQRVAIARAIVNKPDVLLLDESLSALDHKLRKQMQRELKAMHRQLGITFIFVTHDQEEAISMSDNIIVLQEGKVQQIATPSEIYNHPSNLFMARFIGENNIIKIQVLDESKISLLGQSVEADTDRFRTGDVAYAVIRPEDVTLSEANIDEYLWHGIVRSSDFRGFYYETFVQTRTGEMLQIRQDKEYETGTPVGIGVARNDLYLVAEA